LRLELPGSIILCVGEGGVIRLEGLGNLCPNNTQVTKFLNTPSFSISRKHNAFDVMFFVDIHMLYTIVMIVSVDESPFR